MKKSIILLSSIILLTLVAFASDADQDKVIVASFEIENTDSTIKQFKISSITNSNENLIYEIYPSSTFIFEIEKSQKAWNDSKIKIIDETNEQYIQCMSLINPTAHDFSINNKLINIIYDFAKNEKTLNEDEKIYKKVKILILNEEESIILQFSSSKKTNRNQLAPFFYEITGNNIDPLNPVYLLGTEHSLLPKDYSQEIRKRIENTEILISEFAEVALYKTAAKITLEKIKFIYKQFLSENFYWFRDQLMAIGDGPDEIKEKLQLLQEKRNELKNTNFFQSWFSQFTSQFTPKEQEIIKKMASEAEIELMSLHPDFLKYLITIIGEPLELDNIEDSLEIYLIKHFMKNCKEIVFLDTSETLSWAYLDQFFQSMSKNDDMSIDDLKRSIEKYHNQCSSDSLDRDVWDIDEYINALDHDTLIDYKIDRSSNARNKAWQEKVIHALSCGKSASIITGAAHLVDETGFINLLKSYGYHIKHAYLEMDEDLNMELNGMKNFQNWKEDMARKKYND